MKKFKQFIPFLLAAILALAIPLAACDSCKKNKDENKTLVSISVNADNARGVYGAGDKPIKDGLVVTAYYLNSKSKEVKSNLNADDYELIANLNKLGQNTVTVSYTYKDVTETDTYEVNVVDYFDGLELTLLEGVLPTETDAAIDTFYLSQSKPTVEIDTSKIIVKDINDDGTVGDEINDYKVSLYKGQEEVELSNRKATVGGGAYQIWVEKESDYYLTPNKAHATVYVNDDLVSIAKSAGAIEQYEGIDLITSTWKFTLTYASGLTKEVDSAACKFSVNTMSKGTKSATVSYTEYNAKEEKTTKTCTVSYTINEFNGTRKNYSFSYSGLGSGFEDKQVLTQANFTGNNAFLTLGTGADDEVTWRSSNSCIEIKGKGLYVTFEGSGKIDIGFSSTGGSNTSRIGLKDANGNFMHATYTSANVALDDSLDEEGNPYENSYLVTGTTFCTLSFVITKPGTYVIVSEPNVDYNRGCRINAISVIDYVPNV